MEYLAKITTNEKFTFMYTIEKKTALKRALNSQATVIGKSIEALNEVNTYLEAHLPADKIELKAGLNRAICNLRYEKEVVNSFLDELK